jgi:hypothetical protein
LCVESVAGFVQEHAIVVVVTVGQLDGNQELTILGGKLGGAAVVTIGSITMALHGVKAWSLHAETPKSYVVDAVSPVKVCAKAVVVPTNVHVVVPNSL